MKRLKILISAYACSPVQGSEPGMGWNFVLAIAKDHDLTVIVEKEKFEAEINANSKLCENIKFYFIAKKRRRVLRKIWPPSYYRYYKKWQKKAYGLAQELHQKEHFDIIHQLNMLGFREPGYLWKINAPFIWGPIGGTQNTPWRMLTSMGLYGCIYYAARNIYNYFDMHLLKRPLLAARKAGNALIAATPDEAKNTLYLWKQPATVICEVGALTPPDCTPEKADDTLKILWAAQHTPSKALNLLLKALGSLKDIDFSLNILGSGRQTAKWKKLADKLDIQERCEWSGWIDRNEVLKAMKNSDVCVITSLKELTSTVTLEALSCGLPIICLDHCGFAHVVNDTCGIKIPVTNPRQVEKDIGTAIKKLYKNEELRYKLSSGALERVKDFAWDKKAEKLNDIYQKAIEEYSENSNRT